MFAHLVYPESSPLLFNRPSRYRKCANICEVFCAYLLWPLAFMAVFRVLQEVDPLLLNLWGSRSSAYLEQYRSGVARTWRTAHRLAQGDLWFVYILLAYIPVILGSYLFKHKLGYYKVVNLTFMAVLGFLVLALMQLILRPLG